MKRLGIAISHAALRVVAVARGRAVWAAERSLDGAGEIAGALAELAAERPRGVRRARVALVGNLIQTKLISGLPSLTARQLDRAVALQAGRWFLENGRPLVTGVVRRLGGEVVAVAIERDVLEGVTDGAGRAGLRLDAVGGTVGSWARLLGDGDHRLTVDGVTHCLSVKGEAVRVWRRGREGTGTADTAADVPGLGPDGARFFTAYAAGMVRPSPSFPLEDDGERGIALGRRALRLAIAAAMLWVAAAGVLALRVVRVVTESRRELVALGPAVDAAIAVERDLLLADELLAAVRAAEVTRSRDAALLARLSRLVPDSAHLQSLRRGREGRVVMAAVGPSASRVLAALAAAPGVIAAALRGGVTRDPAGSGGRGVEHFAVMFGWRAAGNP